MSSARSSSPPNCFRKSKSACTCSGSTSRGGPECSCSPSTRRARPGAETSAGTSPGGLTRYFSETGAGANVFGCIDFCLARFGAPAAPLDPGKALQQRFFAEVERLLAPGREAEEAPERKKGASEAADPRRKSVAGAAFAFSKLQFVKNLEQAPRGLDEYIQKVPLTSCRGFACSRCSRAAPVSRPSWPKRRRVATARF